MATKSFSISDIEKTILNSPLKLSGETSVIEAVRLMSQVRETCHLTLALVQSDENLLNYAEQASCVLVVKNKKLIGIFTETDIVRCTALGLNLEQATLAEVMIQNPVTIRKSQFTNIFVVLNLFRQHKTRHLVVVDEQDNLIGLVTPTTVRQLLQASDLLKIRTIGEVMTSEVITAPPTTSVLKLAQLMAEYSVSCVVITESDSQAIGIVTERDIVQMQALELDILKIKAHIVMSTPLFYAFPHQSLWESHQQMQQRHIRRLVVVNERNQLLGIVTQTNILYSLDPLAMYETINFLQSQVYQLEAEKVEILQKQKIELEIQVQEHTQKLRQQTHSERLLTTLSQKVRRTLDLESILQTTVSEVRAYLKADRVIIYQFQSLVSGEIVAESLLPHITSIFGRVIGDSCFADRWLEPYLNGRVRRIEDIYTSGLTDCHIQLLETANIRANLIVPIIYNHQLWGLLCAHQCYRPRYWQLAEAELLEKLSTQIAIAIQQSQLYQEAQKELIERQQAEIILKKLNEQLETRVAERTAELQQINQNLLLEIRQRKRIEKKLQNQLETIEATIDGIAILRDEKYIYLNKSHLEMFGYDNAEQLIGQSWRELYDPDELVRFESEVFPILSQAGYWRGEATAKRRDGSIFNEEVSLTLTKDGELICVCRDITESKQAEAKLQKLLQELSDFKYALDQSAIVAITDTQGNITYANNNFCEISQYSRAELIGKNHRIINSGYNSQEYFQNLWSTIINGQVWRGEIKNRAKDGTNYWVDSTIVPFLDHSGIPWQYLAISKDITDRKQAEQEICKALEREKELGELKSRFVSMTSHEFRTPLAVISSSAAILKDFGHKLDDTKKKKHLDCIQTYVKHTTQLLDDILLINKAENGKLAFEPAPLDIIPFCQKLTEEIQLSAPNHTIVFASNPQWCVSGNLDKKLLRQILINLLSNAIKYSPHNTTVNFNLNITESTVVFMIQDQGIGIPEADISQLFESFHRAGNVGTIPGTGLGLSIVAKCVNLHHGSIVVNSAEGMGTTFIVTIPLQSVVFWANIVNNTDQ